MAPCIRRGPAVEWLPLQALQQGAGERIPVARLQAIYCVDRCQGGQMTALLPESL